MIKLAHLSPHKEKIFYFQLYIMNILLINLRVLKNIKLWSHCEEYTTKQSFEIYVLMKLLRHQLAVRNDQSLYFAEPCTNLFMED
jgi:hypothetical protein